MTKEIQLTQGKVAIVDDDDFEYINRWKWYYGSGYARRTDKTNREKWRAVKMHREIMQAQPGQHVDHINGNPLDCRKENMRFATPMQNRWNQVQKFSNPSGYRGVTLHKPNGRWRARITVNWKSISLGVFIDPIDAAIAYDAAAIFYFGEFAQTNFKNPLDRESS